MKPELADIESIPLGSLAMIQTEEGHFFFLTPIRVNDYNPAIRIHRGVCGLPCYVIPNNIGSPILQGLVNVGLGDLDARWYAALCEALAIMTRIWRAITESCENLKQKEGVAKAMIVSPHAMTVMMTVAKIGDLPGYPKDAESYVKSLITLTYWAGLCRHRNPTPQQGMSWPKAAAILNHDCHILFPNWQEWGWKDFTADALRRRVDRLSMDSSPLK